MAKYVLTVVTSDKGHFHAAFDTEEDAKAAQRELFEKLNDAVPPNFVQVGDSTVRLVDIASSKVTPEEHAPGYGTSDIAVF